MATRAQQAAAMERRRARFSARVEVFTDRILANANLTANQRVTVATQLVRDRVVINLSRPVTKTRAQGRDSSGRFRGMTVVSDRSRPGEYPRADTTRLMKSIFGTVSNGVGRVGTPLDYGLILETRMNRSFLVRTFNEVRGMIVRILAQGGGGGLGLSGTLATGRGGGGAAIGGRRRNLGGL